jgi:signal transduction histidine kinase/ligand-binding sensor protein
LVDLSGFQQVMQSWYIVAGVATALLDTDRNSLCAVGWHDICARFHHLSPEAGGRCTQSDDTILSRLHEGSYVAHQCVNGLMNCAMPVVVKGEHVASLFMGQFLHEPPDEAFFRRQAQELGVDEQAYLAALRQVPVISEERLRVVLEAQTRLAQMLATMGLEHKQLEVDNAQLYRETRRRQAEGQALQRVATALLHKVSPEKVLEIVCAEAQQLTGATASTVLLLDAPRDAWLRVAYSTAAAAAFFDHIPVEGSLAGVAVRRDEPFLTNNPASEAYEYLRGKRPTAFLSVPLHASGDVIGVLEVLDKPAGFVKDDVRIVSLFANQAAINIERARLNQQAGQLAVLEERQRLARELHDSVVQSLYSMALYADAGALALTAGKREVTLNHLQELRDTARTAMHDMRLLIFELHPPALEEEGLVTALRLRLAAVEARAGLTTELDVKGERRLPITIEQELYRIAQEALNNVTKHADAQHVTIRLQYGQTTGHPTVYLQVHDDGIGFDPLTARNAGGVGLRSFGERAAKLGGKVTVESSPGKGTTVTVEIEVEGAV